MNMKRRPNHNNNGGNNGGGRHYNNRNRRFSRNSNSAGGQDDSANVSRIRRNATAQREKYVNMARDAMSSGDRVQAEYYLQHAEHHFRVLSSLPPEEPRYNRYQQQPQDGQSSPDNASTQNESADLSHDAPEEVIVNTAGTALPSFITGVRDDNREPARVADQE